MHPFKKALFGFVKDSTEWERIFEKFYFTVQCWDYTDWRFKSRNSLWGTQEGTKNMKLMDSLIKKSRNYLSALPDRKAEKYIHVDDKVQTSNF